MQVARAIAGVEFTGINGGDKQVRCVNQVFDLIFPRMSYSSVSEDAPRVHFSFRRDETLDNWWDRKTGRLSKFSRDRSVDDHSAAQAECLLVEGFKVRSCALGSGLL